ncbi:hypothetical protein F8M41_026351 [Gigaspora margarita]|uniref:Uncharacterized protein n=1 Tax=Gigaspora margarita TaxID=4874 RepID=A0A8H4AZP1_GIGMA|nr:hypothetical protein F8M41_026351 [Gigaspora margarita]
MNFIFAFILFALILTANAAPFNPNKTITSFITCPFDPSYGVDILYVTMRPDPPESGKNERFDIFGTLTNHDITKGTTIIGIYANQSLGSIGTPYSSQYQMSPLLNYLIYLLLQLLLEIQLLIQ